METLKKFRLYLIMFIALFIVITLLTNLTMRDEYKNIKNIVINIQSLEVKVTECKVKSSSGYIKGSVTNNSNEIIPLKYLKINLYDKDDVYLGSEYKELKSFYPKETINFDIKCNYMHIEKVTIDLVDEIPDAVIAFLNDIEDEQVRIALPIASILMLQTILTPGLLFIF